MTNNFDAFADIPYADQVNEEENKLQSIIDQRYLNSQWNQVIVDIYNKNKAQLSFPLTIFLPRVRGYKNQKYREGFYQQFAAAMFVKGYKVSFNCINNNYFVTINV
jgi:hypothetical protein